MYICNKYNDQKKKEREEKRKKIGSVVQGVGLFDSDHIYVLHTQPNMSVQHSLIFPFVLPAGLSMKDFPVFVC